MVKRFRKYLEQKGVADDGSFSLEYEADADYMIKNILFTRKDGASFTETEATITIADIPYTRDKILVSVLGSDHLNAWPIDEDLPKGNVIKIEGYNREGVTLDIVVHLFLEKK